MELKVLTLNFWLLPQPLSIDNEKRIEKFLSFVKKEDPDIIFLQEVWLKSYLKYLKKGLKNYFIYHGRNRFYSPYNKSGLVTFSKIKAEKSKLNIFPQRIKFNIVESIAKKGFLKTKIKLGNKEISLINTHFYWPLTKKQEEIDVEQLNFIKEKTKGENIVLGGDLNMDIKKFDESNDNYFNRDDEKTFTYAYHNKYVRRQLHMAEQINRKIDYILARSDNEVKINAKVVNPIIVSDHFPLVGKVKIM